MLRRCFSNLRSKSWSKATTMGKDKKKPPEKPKETPTGPVSKDDKGNIVIRINAKPSAQQSQITGWAEDGVSVQIAAPPSEGEANKELVKTLSKVLGVSKGSLVLDKGAKSKQKTVLLTGCSLSVDKVTELLQNQLKT